MARAFKRKYELVICQPAETIIDRDKQSFRFQRWIFSNPQNIDNLVAAALTPASDYTTINPSRQITITELNITAKIGSSKSSTTTTNNDNHITVINPSVATQNFVKAKYQVLLRAGYEGEGRLPLVYVGQIESVQVEKVGQDTEMKLVIQDSANVKNNVHISRSWTKGVPYSTIVNDFISTYASNGVPLGRLVESTVLDYQTKGYVAEGMLQETFDSFCEGLGYKNYTSLGKLYIEPKQLNSPEVKNPTTQSIFVSSDVVKGGIRVNSNSKTDKSNPEDGIIVETFLNANLSIASLLIVDYGRFEGFYKITSVSHKLDLRGKDWDTVVVAQKLE